MPSYCKTINPLDSSMKTEIEINLKITVTKDMSQKELIKELLDGRITCEKFLKKSDMSEKFEKWCLEHGIIPDEQSAEFYIDMTVDIDMLEPVIIYDPSELEDIG